MTLQNNKQTPSTEFERWECHNHTSPVLLGMVDHRGHLQIKVRNRTWFVSDFTSIAATCPKCGQEHIRWVTDI